MNDGFPMKSEERLARRFHSLSGVHHGLLIALPVLLLACLGCATLQVPLKIPAFKPDEMLRVDKSGLTLAIKPIEGVNEYWNLFNDNLPEIGIAAAWVEFRNAGDATLDLSKCKWSLQIGARTFDRMENSKVLSRYYKLRHIRMYLVSADRKAQQELENIAFHQGRLRPSGNAEGLIFFQIDPSLAPRWTQGATMQVGDVRTAAGKRFDLSLSLAYATP